MTRHVIAVACVAASVLAYTPSPSRAQSAGAILGGVIGGVIAGSIAAQAARRPVVVYGRPHRTVRVVRAAPRARVARSPARPITPAAGPQGAAVISASTDPFASGPSGATTVARQAR